MTNRLHDKKLFNVALPQPKPAAVMEPLPVQPMMEMVKAVVSKASGPALVHWAMSEALDIHQSLTLPDNPLLW